MNAQLALYKFFSFFRTTDKQLAARAEVLELYYRIYGVQYKSRTMGLNEILTHYDASHHESVREVYAVVATVDLWGRTMQNKSRWASIIVRRYWVARLWMEEHDHVIADIIRDMYPMAHPDLSQCTAHDIANDRASEFLSKYRNDYWKRPAA